MRCTIREQNSALIINHASKFRDKNNNIGVRLLLDTFPSVDIEEHRTMWRKVEWHVVAEFTPRRTWHRMMPTMINEIGTADGDISGILARAIAAQNPPIEQRPDIRDMHDTEDPAVFRL
jgi:hypothetical protein